MGSRDRNSEPGDRAGPRALVISRPSPSVEWSPLATRIPGCPLVRRRGGGGPGEARLEGRTRAAPLCPVRGRVRPQMRVARRVRPEEDLHPRCADAAGAVCAALCPVSIEARWAKARSRRGVPSGRTDCPVLRAWDRPRTVPLLAPNGATRCEAASLQPSGFSGSGVLAPPRVGRGGIASSPT